MNLARVAALLRELADEFDRDSDAVPAPPKSKPRRRKRSAPSYPAPLRPASDVAKMRAQKMLRERGIG